MYKAVFPSGISDDKYFRDNELLFIVKTKQSVFGVNSKCKIYKDENLIFSFYETVFTRLFWKLTILTQDLDKKLGESLICRRSPDFLRESDGTVFRFKFILDIFLIG